MLRNQTGEDLSLGADDGDASVEKEGDATCRNIRTRFRARHTSLQS